MVVCVAWGERMIPTAYANARREESQEFGEFKVVQ